MRVWPGISLLVLLLAVAAAGRIGAYCFLPGCPAPPGADMIAPDDRLGCPKKDRSAPVGYFGVTGLCGVGSQGC